MDRVWIIWGRIGAFMVNYLLRNSWGTPQNGNRALMKKRDSQPIALALAIAPSPT